MGKDEAIERLNQLAEERLAAYEEERWEDWDKLAAEARLIEQSLKQAGYEVSVGGDQKHYLERIR